MNYSIGMTYDIRYLTWIRHHTTYDIRDLTKTVPYRRYIRLRPYTVRKKDRMYDIRLLPKSASYPITIFHASSLLSRASAAAATQARTL